jgi:hypothetical protein
MTFQRSAIALSCATLVAACGGGGGGAASGARAQSVDFGYPGARLLGSAPAPLVATTSSGLAVTFSSNTPSNCTVSEGKLVPVAAGECSITATQAGDGTYAPASSQQLFKILKQSQEIAFDTPGAQALGQKTEPLVAVSDAGLVPTISSLTPEVCAVSGTTLTLLAKGVCGLAAAQDGNASYDAAIPKVAVFDVLDTLPPKLTVLSGFASTSATKEGGAINTFSGSNFDGWNCSDPNWCGAAIDASGSFSYHYLFQPKDPKYPNNDGWSGGYVGFDIVAPGVGNISNTGHTMSGVQVAAQTRLRVKLGVNKQLYLNFNNKNNEVKVTLVLGHFNLKGGNACNVALATRFLPLTLAATAYELKLSDFKLADGLGESCGLSNIDPAAELSAYPIVKLKIEAASANTTVADMTFASPTYPTVITLAGPVTIQ